ncbi:MAG: hypothetical protein ACLSAO_01385 [Anaerovoracaceae bacterium]
MIYGVVDVGSNTVRLCIYDVKDGRITSMFNNKTTAGLIGYVNDGELSRAGIKKACDILGSYKKMAEHAKVKELFVFATASFRNISNTKEAVSAIKKETGLDVDVLSGYDEAVLDFKGAAHAMNLEDGIMVDIGGGSTELLVFESGKIKDTVSLEFGSLFMYKTYVSRLFPKGSEKKAIRKRVKAELNKTDFLKNRTFDTMLGIGGTIRAVKKFNNDRFGLKSHNDIILVSNMKELMEEFEDDEKQVLNKVLKVAPERVHTLIPGMIILDTLCRYFKCRQIKMSSFGVREGYLYKKAVIKE